MQRLSSIGVPSAVLYNVYAESVCPVISVVQSLCSICVPSDILYYVCSIGVPPDVVYNVCAISVCHLISCTTSVQYRCARVLSVVHSTQQE
jgi:hypothetical protein